MYNPDTDLLFPPRAIPSLSGERNATWRELVSAVEKSGQGSTDQTAFILMMARLNTCATCNADSYRAMNGCATCARQSLKRFRGSDEELVEMFQTVKEEVERYIQKKGW